MRGIRPEALSLIADYEQQCGSYLFEIGTRHAVMSTSVWRNFEYRSRHRGIRVVGVLSRRATRLQSRADVVGAPRSIKDDGEHSAPRLLFHRSRLKQLTPSISVRLAGWHL
jgi:hypothetical protein